MPSAPSTAPGPAPLRRFGPLICWAATAAVALLPLAGNLLGRRGATTFGAPFPPMEPLGAILFLLLAGGLILNRPLAGPGTRAGRTLLALVASGALLALAGRALGFTLPLDHGMAWGGAPRHMSWLAAAAQLAAVLAAGFLAQGRRRLGGYLALLPLALGALVLLTYAAGAPLLASTGLGPPLSLPGTLCALTLGAGLALEQGAGAWPWAAFRPKAQAPGVSPWSNRGPMLVFLALILAIGLGGARVFRAQAQAARTARQLELAAISELKARQISEWYRERLGDAALLSGGEIIRGPLRDFLRGSRTADLEPWLEALRRTAGYTRLVLYDGQGRPRLAVPRAPAAAPAEFQAALQGSSTLITDPRRDPGEAGGHFSFLTPIPATTRPGGPALGVLEMRIATRDFLDPLLAYWPGPSGSAETLLVRRDGGDILYLNDLARIPGSAMRYRIPLAGDAELPAAQAILGREGLMEGRDYRGVPIFASLGRVAGTPWFLVVKVDQAEVLGPIRRWAGFALAGFLGAVALVGFVVRDWISRRELLERQRRTQDLRRLNRLYSALSQVNQSIVWSGNAPELFERIARVLVEHGEFQMAWIGLEDSATHVLRLASRFGEGSEFLDGLEVRTDDSPTGRGPAGLAVRTGQPVVVNRFQADKDAGAWKLTAELNRIAAVGAFPIRLEERVVGVLVVYADQEDFFGEKEILLLEEAAMDLSFALRQFQKEEARQAAEAALRESEAFLRKAQEIGQVGTYSWDLRAGTWTASDYLDTLFGIGPGYPHTVAGWLDLVEPDHRAALLNYVERIQKDHFPFDYDYPILRPADGARRWVHGQGELEWGPDGVPVRMAGVIMDITARREAEQERRALETHLGNVQKLESLGLLAGGIAHDMNNVLAAIMGLASAQLYTAAPESPLGRAMETILKACGRGRDVVRGILFFARRGLDKTGPVDLNAISQDIVQLLGSTTLQRVQLDLATDPGVPKVIGDGVALSHALMNLCVNAVDAMPQGGALQIRVARGPHGGAEIRIKDDGEGMPPEVLARAMEPFFTTKPAGKGTGLGLAMVYGTMKAHEGELELTSAPGQGTLAVLRFPASRLEGGAIPLDLSQARPALGQALDILVVDDDALVRDSSAALLRTLGHQVRLAEHGLAALNLLEEGLEVDVVILDMNMPVLDGARTLPRIMALRPAQPVLIATGYSDQELGHLLRAHPSVSTLEKPFTLADLSRKLAEVARIG